jgi:hypothetical protein
MSSPTYPAYVDNSTVCPPASDESPKSARVAGARGPALCWEVWRAFKRLFDGEDVPAWADIDEETRRRYLDLYWRTTPPDAAPGRNAADTAREGMQYALLDGVVQAVDQLDYWTEKLGGEG